MEPEKNNKSGTDASELEQSVSFQHVSSVATGWMVDFMFRSLCRHFNESEFEEFNETLSVFEGELLTANEPVASSSTTDTVNFALTEESWYQIEHNV